MQTIAKKDGKSKKLAILFSLRSITLPDCLSCCRLSRSCRSYTLSQGDKVGDSTKNNPHKHRVLVWMCIYYI